MARHSVSCSSSPMKAMDRNNALCCGLLGLMSVLLSGCGGGGGTTTTTTPYVWRPFSCTGEKSTQFKINKAPSKGLALDDTTFLNCSEDIMTTWPHTGGEKVKSLRLFKPWGPDWPQSARDRAWLNIQSFVKANGAKVLVGTQITCSETDDDKDWELVKQLLKKLGPDRIMAVAIGNEMDLLWSQIPNKGWPDFYSKCNDYVWTQGYFINKTLARIKDLDSMGEGFNLVPVTSVWGGFALSGSNVCCQSPNNDCNPDTCSPADDSWCSKSEANCGKCSGHYCILNPFHDSPMAHVNEYLTKMHGLYGKRWVFTFNFYPYFDDSNHMDKNTTNQCSAAIARSTCFGEGCVIADILKSTRTKIKLLTGNDDDTLWLGEAGWSTPVASTLANVNKEMADCPDFSAKSSYKLFYERFLAWDLSIAAGIAGVDHVFYFTAHDSASFAHQEYFGLVGACGDTECKRLGDVPDLEKVVV